MSVFLATVFLAAGFLAVVFLAAAFGLAALAVLALGAAFLVGAFLAGAFLAAAFGLLTGLGISFALFKKPDPYYVILGPLAGLVAITAGCNSMTSVTSIFVGVIGAVSYTHLTLPTTYGV